MDSRRGIGCYKICSVKALIRSRSWQDKTDLYSESKHIERVEEDDAAIQERVQETLLDISKDVLPPQNHHHFRRVHTSDYRWKDHS